MSLNVEGSSCARCKAYLFSEDDVVYCPQCGAPHHRDCYNALGHCALEEFHGTPQEYSKEKEIENKRKLAENANEAQKERENNRQENVKTCGMCGEKYDFSYTKCPKCGAPDISRMGGFEGFDFLGGVPADYKIDENVTANDAKLFIGANTQRYVPKFATLNKLNKLSWNWMAFLFPCGWMLSRKMFKGGIIAGLLSVMASILKIPLNLAIYNLGITGAVNSMEMAERLAEALPEIGTAVIVISLIGFFFDLIIRIVFAMFGDYFYKTHAVAQIKKIKAESDDLDYDYRKKGGANIFYFFLGTFAVNYLPSVLSVFF